MAAIALWRLTESPPIRSIVAVAILVVIRDDPRKSHRAVEGLRIALGLSTGQNPLTVVLLDEAPRLLTADPDDLDDIIDGDILTKHLPVLKELRVPFVVPEGTTTRMTLDSGFTVREASIRNIASLTTETERVLVF
jgi:hypothetical protein